MYENYSKTLEISKNSFQFRKIKNFQDKDEKYIYIDSKKLLNLSSNNYLGFADNKDITERFLNYTNGKYSFGSASARLLTGTLPIYNELETLLSRLFNTGKTLLFNSGYHANVGINSSLAGKGDVIFSDKLNHASIIDGMRLSQGKFFRYPHQCMTALEQLLIRERKNFNNAIIISESVFSMDGDIADITRLVELKNRYNCLLVLDEAHAFGVFGKNGLGICEDLNLTSEVDLIIGTFGKAIGSMGAFVTGRKILIDYLINKARPFIFSTALPPVNVAFSKWIIEKELPETYEKRMKMLQLASAFHSESHIIPLIMGENNKTVELCGILYENGYFTLPIRPPTVPEGTSRIRISLTTEITKNDLTKLTEIINAVSLVK